MASDPLKPSAGPGEPGALLQGVPKGKRKKYNAVGAYIKRNNPMPEGGIPAKNGGFLVPAKKGENRWKQFAGPTNMLLAELRTLARQFCPEAINRTVEIMRTSEDDRAVLVAISMLLDRGMGKPKEVVEETEQKAVDVGALSDQELSQLRESLAKMLGGTKQPEKVPDELPKQMVSGES